MICRKKYDEKVVLVIQGGPKETHELAITGVKKCNAVEGAGAGLQISTKNDVLVINWQVTPNRKMVEVEENIYIYLLGMSLTEQV